MSSIQANNQIGKEKIIKQTVICVYSSSSMQREEFDEVICGVCKELKCSPKILLNIDTMDLSLLLFSAFFLKVDLKVL